MLDASHPFPGGIIISATVAGIILLFTSLFQVCEPQTLKTFRFSSNICARHT